MGYQLAMGVGVPGPHSSSGQNTLYFRYSNVRDHSLFGSIG